MRRADAATRRVAPLEARQSGGAPTSAPAIAAEEEHAHAVELQPGETIILAVRAHWLLFLASALPALLGVAIVSAVLLGVQISFGPSLVRPVAIGLALVGALGVGFAYFEHRGRLYILTDRRVIRRAGALRVRLTELPLTEIDTVEVQQAASGDTPDRVGIVVFSGAGGKLAWEFVPEPRRICAVAREAIDRYGSPGRKQS